MISPLKDIFQIKRTLILVWHAGRGWMLAGGVLLLLQGLIPLLALFLMKAVVDAVTQAMGTPDPSAAFLHIGRLIAAAAGVALLQTLCRQLAAMVTETQSQAVTDEVYRILHRQSVSVDQAYYENPAYFDTLHQAQAEGPLRSTHMVNSLAQAGLSGISLLAVAGLLASFHWVALLILPATAAPAVLMRLKHSRRQFNWERRQTPLERKTRYLSWLMTGDIFAKEIRIFDLGKLFMWRFDGFRRLLRKERLALAKQRTRDAFYAEAVATAAVFGTLAWVAHRTVSGRLTIGDMVMYLMAFRQGLDYLKNLLAAASDLYEDNLFLSHFFRFLDLPSTVTAPREPVAVPKVLRRGVSFENVNFSYPGEARQVLKDINFTIDPGKVVALVGENGCGKTTIVKLLCRLYDPCGGRICLDGIDLREFDPTALRRVVSVIFQDYVRYNQTLRENIWFGNIQVDPEKDTVEQAAGRAGAHQMIRTLTRGLDTPLGKWFEKGAELSTGQWQKIAMARAFFRDAPIMVLDEPASALDIKSEYTVFRHFRKQIKDRSALIISHRLSTVHMADTILVMQQGQIIERGSHATLMDLGGQYCEMFQKQAEHYQYVSHNDHRNQKHFPGDNSKKYSDKKI